VATFLDVAALVDERISGANFADLALAHAGSAYLADLGVSALELLPPADSFFKREWGYDTSHYLSPDCELGYPEGDLSPTANQDLARLVDACHQKGIRFFIDAVMAFAKEEPYNHIDAPDFCIDDPRADPSDPDSQTSGRADGHRDPRNGFGSTLWRYAKPVTTYGPVSGQPRSLFPARQLMRAASVSDRFRRPGEDLRRGRRPHHLPGKQLFGLAVGGRAAAPGSASRQSRRPAEKRASPSRRSRHCDQIDPRFPRCGAADPLLFLDIAAGFRMARKPVMRSRSK